LNNNQRIVEEDALHHNKLLNGYHSRYQNEAEINPDRLESEFKKVSDQIKTDQRSNLNGSQIKFKRVSDQV